MVAFAAAAQNSAQRLTVRAENGELPGGGRDVDLFGHAERMGTGWPSGTPDGRGGFFGGARCEVTFQIVPDDILITDWRRLP